MQFVSFSLLGLIPFLGNVIEELAPIPPVGLPENPPVGLPENPRPGFPANPPLPDRQPSAINATITSMNPVLNPTTMSPFLNNHISQFRQRFGNLTGTRNQEQNNIRSTYDHPIGPQQEEFPAVVALGKRQKLDDYQPMDEDYIDPDL